MNNNPHKQRGVITLSVLGSLILLVIVLILAGKLIPIYLDNNAVKSMLTNLETNKMVELSRPSDVRNRITKQLRVNSVKSVSADAISVVGTRESFEVDITYQVKIPLAYNIEMLISFSDQAEIPRR